MWTDYSDNIAIKLPEEPFNNIVVGDNDHTVGPGKWGSMAPLI